MVNNFGEKVRQIRKDKNMTIAKLSSLCGISMAQITNIEKGRCKPTVNNLFKLANSLNVSYDYLFNEMQK